MTTPAIFAGMMGSSRGADIGDNIPNSLMLDPSASQYLSRTPTVAGNRKTFTFSFWSKLGDVSTTMREFFNSWDLGNNEFAFDYRNGAFFLYSYATTTQLAITTAAVFRDPSAHYHIVGAIDTTAAVASDRAKIFVNGVLQTVFSATYPTQNADLYWNVGSKSARIGGRENNTSFFSGYLSQSIFVDGQALDPTAFGRFSADTGQWVPKNYTGAYGTNGFKLDFTNGTALGTDSSGNGNHWAVNGGITSANQYTDTPTNNYAIMNPLSANGSLISKGNTKATASANVQSASSSMQFPSSGAYYFEAKFSVLTASTTLIGTSSKTNYRSNGQIYNGATLVGTFSAYTTADTIGVAVDCNNSLVSYYKNSVLQTIVPVSAIGEFILTYFELSGHSVEINFGARPFAYPPPAGFKALCTANLPTPAIIKAENHWTAVLDTGPNIKTNLAAKYGSYLNWIKDRANVNNHQLIDTVRGASAVLQSNTIAAETVYSAPAGSSVGWAWKAGDTTVTNNAGSITSQVSANVLAGLSIVTYTGTGIAGTIGHGLGKTPSMVIAKARTGTARNWPVLHGSLPIANGLLLDTTGASAAYGFWGGVTPSNGLFSVSADLSINAVGVLYVAYCFAEVEGYSKIGSYIGNGSADGPFVNCGFKTRFLMIKRTDVVSNWITLDSARDLSNPETSALFPNLTSAEQTSYLIDITGSGFKLRTTTADLNTSGGTYIYYAIAEAPIKYATAR